MKLSFNEENLTGLWAKLPGLLRNGALALPDGGMEKIVDLLRLTHSSLNRPNNRQCGFTPLLAFATSSVLTVKDNFIS